MLFRSVGAIIDALRQQGLLDNTVIIFSTDHADYLGDHNLIGKASFYESAWKIPLLARISGSVPGQVCNDLVELRDVTATMLSTAGVDIPKHMDSRPLPGLGLMGDSPRERIIGMLTDGWCNFDGEWKLAKYATGESVLFNLIDDPDEQRNLAPDPDYSELYRRLDIELTQELMESYRFAMHDRLAQAGDMSQDQGFGREGWSRPWPAPVDFADSGS